MYQSKSTIEDFLFGNISYLYRSSSRGYFFALDSLAERKDSSKAKLSDIFKDKFRNSSILYAFGHLPFDDVPQSSKLTNPAKKNAVFSAGIILTSYRLSYPSFINFVGQTL